MINVSDKLEKLLFKIQYSGIISESECVDLISLTRNILERYNLQSKYNLLNFYCNWVLHIELSKLSHCFSILEGMVSAIAEYSTIGDGGSLRENISTAISIDKLKEEFKMLFIEKALPIYLFDNNSNWRVFLIFLIERIKDKEITFPENIKKVKKKEIYNSTMAKIKGLRLDVPVRFWISDILPGTWKSSEIPINYRKPYAWNLGFREKGKNLVTIKGLILI